MPLALAAFAPAVLVPAALVLAFGIGGRAALAATPRANHLAGQSSPYLLQHADNPVDWYPWGEEALQRARREDRPIFLSIGYSACHWCHVMEREAFSDDGIAAILNEHFVSIKVDREERPDLDDLYMDAVLISSGGGGWPMSVFLTPDLKPFLGGTYFPKDRFRALLLSVADSWKNRRPDVLAAADSVRQGMQALRAVPAATSAAAAGASRDPLPAAVAALRRSFDRQNGGFGRAPKFPPHGSMALLLRAYQDNHDAAALDMVAKTLRTMARGGVYDQVGGGFHRYATDAAWRIPHFEKMLYDNALLVPLYLMAWKAEGGDDLRQVAVDTLAWVSREMTDPGGGFRASLDADSDGEEGQFYLWSAADLRAALGPDDALLLGDYYGVPTAASGGGSAVLRVVQDDAAFSKRHQMTPDAWRKRLASAKVKLLAARARRTRPRTDDKVLTAWNGLMISALAVAHRATGDVAYRDEARRAAQFALDKLRDPDGRILVSWRQGRAGGPGFPEDAACLTRGLLDLFATDPDPRWLKGAIAVQRDAARFEDRNAGGFVNALLPFSPGDGALPSGNALMAENLARLALLTGDMGDRQKATLIIDRARPWVEADPVSHAYMILARDTVLTANAVPAPAVTPAAATAVVAAAVSDTAPPRPEATGGSRNAPIIPGAVVGRANKERVVESGISLPEGTFRPGSLLPLSLHLTIKSGWHINSSTPTLEYLIPTSLKFTELGVAVLAGVDYPEGHLVRLEFADDQLSVYENDVLIVARLQLPASTPAGALTTVARLTYQACSNKACLPPETVEFRLPIAVAGEPVAEAPRAETGAASTAPLTGKGAEGRVEGQDQLSVLLRERGLLFVIGVVFLGGLALTLTPCVYPMIPVTIGFFSNQAADARFGRRVALPALYVLGMALTYSVLGVVAGLSGGLFGATLQSPFVVGFMVLLFIAMALWMFGVYELRLPGALTQLGTGRSGAIGAFVMGLTLGLVAAPCIGPFIVTLLAFVGASRNPILGFWLFFVLALGMGLPFLVLGTFSGMLSNLPRSGVWLIYAKKVMGVGLLAVALYFLQPFLSDKMLGYAALFFAVAAGLYLGWLEKTRMKGPLFVPIRIGIGVLAVVCGAWLALPLVRAREEAHWQTYSQGALDAARAEHRPILIDFFAVWCAPCRELDRHTYSDPAVLDAIARFAIFKADLTNEESPQVLDLRDRYEVYGVPTVVFIDAQGVDRKDLRLTGFEKPELFVDRLRQVR